MKAQGLYSPQYEHDACGVGFVVNMDGRAEHGIVERGVQVLVNLSTDPLEVEVPEGSGILIGTRDDVVLDADRLTLPPEIAAVTALVR